MGNGLIEVMRFPGYDDLLSLSDTLSQRGVRHVFSEERGEQVLWIADESERHFTLQVVEEYFQSDTKVPRKKNVQLNLSRNIRSYFKQAPATAMILVLGVLGYLMVDVFNSRSVFALLSFWPVSLVFSEFQFWRLVSPAFMHFGVLHILFNGVWIALLGHRLEMTLGPSRYLLLFVFTAFGGNALQFYVSGANNFGGLSGVVYGYVGAYVSAHWIFKNKAFYIQDGLLIFFLISMGLSFTGAFDWLAGAGIANWAHFGGFIFGSVFLASLLYLKNLKWVK